MYHIVVVEDNKDMQAVYHHMIVDALNTEPVIFSDGFEALKHLKAHTPDLLILDVNLPGCPGLTLLKHVRMKLGMTSDKTKIIIATANTLANQSPEVKMADQYLEKPIRPHLFTKLIQNLIAESGNHVAL